MCIGILLINLTIIKVTKYFKLYSKYSSCILNFLLNYNKIV